MSTIRLILIFFLLALTDPTWAKTIHIGLDVSGSVRLLENPAYAKLIAQYARDEIEKLQFGDWVYMHRFGERKAENLAVQKIRITKKSKPAEVANAVARHIAELPARMPDGDKQTNIIAWLEFSRFNCSENPSIYIFSDFVESSSYISAKKLLAGKSLPVPETPFLRGCSLIAVGLGQTEKPLPPSAIKHLKKTWTEFFKAAGVNSFTPIINP